MINTYSNSKLAADAIRESCDMSLLALTALIDNLVNLLIDKTIVNVKNAYGSSAQLYPVYRSWASQSLLRKR